VPELELASVVVLVVVIVVVLVGGELEWKKEEWNYL
jgi:hypothetical protein